MRLQAVSKINPMLSKVSVHTKFFEIRPNGQTYRVKSVKHLIKILKKPIPTTQITTFLMKKMPQVSLHSFRRGSMAFMSQHLKVPEKQIYLLSQHAQKDEPIIARLYLNHYLSTRRRAASSCSSVTRC